VTAGPRPVADLDAAVAGALKYYHRSRWVTAIGAIALLAAAVAVLGVLYLQQDTRLRASCGFWRTLAPLPVTPAPGVARPSRLGVLIVTGSREAYAGQGCGQLPPADPSVRRWAAYYKIDVP
jgi:hypothetical protein